MSHAVRGQLPIGSWLGKGGLCGQQVRVPAGDDMSLTRRDVIKAGVFAGAALSIPLSRVVSGQSQLDSRMPASKLPKPFTTKFVTPPVAVPVRSDATTDYYQMTMEATPLEVIPGFKTMFFAYREFTADPTRNYQPSDKTTRTYRHREPKPT